jgi:hypothetical protein
MELDGILDRTIEGAGLGGNIQRLKAEAYAWPGEAGRRAVDALMAIQRGLSGKDGME